MIHEINIDTSASLGNIKGNISQNTTTVNAVFEIVYNNPILNNPGLLKVAMAKFSLQQIAELSGKLDQNLIRAAMNNKNGDLIILGGFMSLENVQTFWNILVAFEKLAALHG